jgi:nickel transport system substrate-binding protein
MPELATSWETERTESGGEKYTFTLRENVTFHDGSAFNCSVVKLNFDHILHDAIKVRHDWMASIDVIESWECNARGQFEIVTKTVYAPLLQELTYARPYVIASAETFANGLDSDPVEENACIEFKGRHEVIEETINCVGLSGSIGTGPWKFASRTPKDGEDDVMLDAEVVFEQFDDYWGPLSGIQVLKIVHYATDEETEAALLSGELDMVIGNGALTPQQVVKFKEQYSSRFDVRHTEIFQHAMLWFNSDHAPTDDVNVRLAVVHAIDKGRYIKDNLSSLEQPAAQVFPYNAPYCNLDLQPKLSYDPDKALLLNCDTTTTTDDTTMSTGAIVGIAVGCSAAVIAFALVAYMVAKEKSGNPVFQPSKAATSA